MILFLTLAQPATAAVPDLLKNSGLARELSRELPSVIRVPSPLLRRSAAGAAGELYGSGTRSTEQALRSATDAHVQAVTAAVTARNARASDRDAIRECVSTSLKGVAGNYRTAAQNAAYTGEAPVWPSFEGDFAAAMSGCLTSSFPAAPTEAVRAVSDYFGQQAAVYARQALDANSSVEVLERWLDVTADEVELAYEPTDAPIYSEAGSTSSDGSSGDDSSFSWALVLGILAVVAVAGLVTYSRRSSS